MLEGATGLTTSETGQVATFTVKLAGAPLAEVSVEVSSTDTGEGVASPAKLVFTVDDWASPREVVVTGQDDALADGAQTFGVVLSSAKSLDAAYDGVDVPDVVVTNLDDDVAAVTVVAVGGLTTSEKGEQATFIVALGAQPSAAVQVPIASSDPGEGQASPTSLTFTPEGWSTAQVVTVTGQDDALADGPQPYVIVTGPAISADPAYAGLDGADVPVTNLDDEDGAGVVVGAASGPTSETGGAATFTVVLTSQPAAPVTIAVFSTNVGEGLAAPGQITFTPDDWSTPKVVTVVGVDDPVVDGAAPYFVELAAAQSLDPQYAGIDPDDVALVNLDDEQPVEIVSVDGAEQQGSGWSLGTPAVSSDGRYVAFRSAAPDLVAGDTNGEIDVFVRDRVAGETTRVSVKSGGGELGGESGEPDVSGDGRYVVFTSRSSNLPGYNQRWQVYRHDRKTSQTIVVSTSSTNVAGSSDSAAPAVSADGRYVAFHSLSVNLPGGPFYERVFVKDLVTGELELISTPGGGVAPDGPSKRPRISADGRYVAFASSASNLAPGATSGPSVYLADRATKQVQLVSVRPDGVASVTGDPELSCDVSDDGRYVVFASDDPALVTSGSNGLFQIYRRDMVLGVTALVTANAEGQAGVGYSVRPRISADGSRVVFATFASNLAPNSGTINGQPLDVLMKDLTKGTFTLLSRSLTSTSGNGDSDLPAISADGSVGCYQSIASDLVLDDAGNDFDVFCLRVP